MNVLLMTLASHVSMAIHYLPAKGLLGIGLSATIQNRSYHTEGLHHLAVRKISVQIAIVVIGSSSSRVFNKLLDANSLSTSRRAGVAGPVESTNFT